MNSRVICAVCGAVLTAVVVAEELNPRLAYKIPAHTHQEGVIALITATSPITTTSGTSAVITKSMKYVVKTHGVENV